ncbi:hypothetical protein SAMN05216391_10828 [Lachnospiraceae bacterium KHCPX20]|nr:hypothetical protein SAMN05216391_10828 [Lachnospiraceae bacterium KHCPX20]
MLMMTGSKIKEVISSEDPSIQDVITISQLLSTEGAWIVADGYIHWERGIR